MTLETLQRLEAQVEQQIGKEMSTLIAVNPGVLRELLRVYRASLVQNAETK